MKRAAFVILVLVLWLATCSAPQPEISAPDHSPTPLGISDSLTIFPH